MKHLYFLLIALFMFSGVGAQIVNIPDPAFKAKLLSGVNTFNLAGLTFQVDTNGDGEIQQSEANNVGTIQILNSNVTSVVGINSFTNLKKFYCNNSQISAINISGLSQFTNFSSTGNPLVTLELVGLPALQSVICNNSSISTLTLTNLGALQSLDCSVNPLTTLTLTNLSALKTLDCSTTELSIFNFNGLGSLEKIVANNVPLASLGDVTAYPNVKYMELSGVTFTAFDLSTLPFMEHFLIDSFFLSSLNLAGSNNLKYLECDNYQSEAITVSNLPKLESLLFNVGDIKTITMSGLPNLTSLDCNGTELENIIASDVPNLHDLYLPYNHISSFGFLSDLPNVVNVNAPHNLATMVDISGFANNIESMYLGGNQLTSLIVKNGKPVDLQLEDNPNLHYICGNENMIDYYKGIVNGLGYTCEVNSYCTFTPSPPQTYSTINVSCRYDENNDGCDSNDNFYKPFIFNIVNQSPFVVVAQSGIYTVTVPDGVSQLIPHLENPAYFSVSPNNVTLTTTAAASPYAQNFCITPNGIHNDLEVTLIPLMIARPGFTGTYKVVYKNKGTQTQSGNIIVTFDDAVSDFENAYPAVSSQAVNTLMWNFTDLHPFESRGIVFDLNLNAPTEVPPLNSGASFNTTAVINGLTDQTPEDNVSNLHETLVNSLDPNDKTCLEGNVVTPDYAGKYVHYTIRFENTGTASAQNIVVKDVIDTNKFDISSLMPVDGSHPFRTRIVNTNQVEFIFENINLPFDDASNDGYVTFKIKTKTSLAAGSSFSNKANIYFDYNFPIVTNTATTNIVALGTPDFDFGKFISIAPNPVKDVLHFDLKEISLHSVSIYNMLGQLVMADTNPVQGTDVSGLKTGNYIVRVYTDKGSATAKFIKQ